MPYMGIDIKTSFLMRKDTDTYPSENNRWSIGSPTMMWNSIYADTFYGNATTTTKFITPITVTVDGDATGNYTFDGSQDVTLTLSIVDDSHNHTSSTITDFDESSQEATNNLFQNATHSGVTFTYDDVNNALSCSVNNPLITFTGDLSGSATITDLGDTTFNIEVVDDSHAHDTQYYTKTLSDQRYYQQGINVDFGGYEITNINLTPSVDSSVTSKKYVDDISTTLTTNINNKLDLSGGTLTGSLNLSGNTITSVGNPTQGSDAVNLDFAEGRYFQLSDAGIMTSNTQVTSYTLQLSDVGKSIDTNSNVIVPDDATVDFTIGSVISITNLSSTDITISSLSGNILRIAGNDTMSDITLSAYGVMTIRKVQSNHWFCMGIGVS